jgi:hypothetical protein
VSPLEVARVTLSVRTPAQVAVRRARRDAAAPSLRAGLAARQAAREPSASEAQRASLVLAAAEVVVTMVGVARAMVARAVAAQATPTTRPPSRPTRTAATGLR